MDHRPALTLDPLPGIDGPAARHLDAAMAGDPFGGVLLLAEEVAADRASAYAVKEGGRRVGSAVLRIDERDAHREGVIVAGGGHTAGRFLARDALPLFEAELASAGVATVRVHTARRGLCRHLERAGYTLAETVWRKVI